MTEAGQKINEKEPNPTSSDYFTCPLYNTEGIKNLLQGICLASCTPALEQDLYPAWNSPTGLLLEDMKIGSVVVGEVTNSCRSGVFVDVGVGCEGFVHKSTLLGQRVTCGSKVEVSIVSLDLEKRQISFKLVSILNKAAGNLGDQELSISTKMSCSACDVLFGSRDEQVMHYKLDWHRYNLKQRIHNCCPVSEEVFYNLADGISSLSGSESESEDTPSGDDSSDTFSSPRRRRSKPLALPVQAIGRRERSSSATSTDTECEDTDAPSPGKSRIHPKVFLKNHVGKVVALYRCVVHGKDNFPSSQGDLIGLIRSVPSQMKWAILLIGGGHFAAAIFNGAEVVHHKTFHRYTVRAKQGGAQGLRDSKQLGHHPKSAGATIRRYNEAALIKDIQDLLASWSEDLRQCNRIFFRAPSFNRVALFSGKVPPFRKDDPRLRNVPFPTRRATYSEVLRVHKLLSNIECFGEHSKFEKHLPRSPRVHLGNRKSKKADDKTSEAQQPQEGSPRKNLMSRETTAEGPTSPKKHQEHSGGETSSSIASDSEASFQLELVEETRDLRETLTEIIATRKPRKKKGHRKRGNTPKRQEDPQAGEKYRFKSALYSACKTGDVNSLLSLLKSLTTSTKAKDISPIIEEPSTSNPHSSSFQRCNIFEQLTGTTKKEDLQFFQGDKEVVPRKRHHSGGYVTDDDICAQRLPRGTRVPLSSSLDSELGRYLKSGVKPKDLEWNDEPVLTVNVLTETVNNGGATFLHIASESGHRDVLRILMENGADPTARNKQNQTPYMLAPDKETRNEFRKFWDKNPKKYDYVDAQIPSPLTEEMEKDQMAKEAQRKKEKRKARKVKIKEQKAVEHQKQLDDDEKLRFLALSDREKRALAAERRLMDEITKRKETEISVLSRCFQCAVNITGKVPFEYNCNRFCTMQCVKEHRKKAREP